MPSNPSLPLPSVFIPILPSPALSHHSPCILHMGEMMLPGCCSCTTQSTCNPTLPRWVLFIVPLLTAKVWFFIHPWSWPAASPWTSLLSQNMLGYPVLLIMLESSSCLPADGGLLLSFLVLVNGWQKATSSNGRCKQELGWVVCFSPAWFSFTWRFWAFSKATHRCRRENMVYRSMWNWG